jgi:hypothetical protein
MVESVGDVIKKAAKTAKKAIYNIDVINIQGIGDRSLASTSQGV